MTVLSLLLPLLVLAQSGKDVFELKSRIGLTDKDESIVQLVQLDGGSRVLLVGKNQLQFWDVSNAKLIASSPHNITGYWTGGLLMRLVSFPNTVGVPLVMNANRMKVSPDASSGITIAGAGDDTQTKSKGNTRAAVVWNLKTGERLGALTRGVGSVREAEFSKDGSTIMTVHGDLKETELAFWDPKMLSHRSSIRVRDLSFQHLSRDGEHVVISTGEANKWVGVTVMSFEPTKGIELWNTRTGKPEKTFSDGAARFLSTTFVSPDNRYVVARTEVGKIVIWDMTGDGAPKHRIEQPASRINDGLMGISSDSRYLLTQTKDEARIYDLNSGLLYRRFPIREENTYKLTDDRRFAVMRGDGWVAAYDLEKEKVAFSYNLKRETYQRENEPNTEFEVERPHISPDSKYLMIDGQSDVRIYDLATGEVIQTLIDPQRAKYDSKGKLKNGGLGGTAGWLAYGNSVYVSAGDGKSLYLWSKN